MPSSKTFSDIYYTCGLPNASTDEIDAWNTLKTGATGTAKLSVGLYYYDLTCANLICEMIGM